jgi:hypothetical protein
LQNFNDLWKFSDFWILKTGKNHNNSPTVLPRKQLS